MGIFNWFKKHTIIQDDFFGSLRYMEAKSQAHGHFEGKGLFKPYAKEIEYIIDADESGPTSEQREFYQRLQDEFERYVILIVPLIVDTFRNWKDDFEIIDFKNEFELVAVSIPRPGTSGKWDMSFTTIHDENHQFTIEFEGEKPVDMQIDG